MTEKRFIFNGLHIRDTLNIIPPIMTHNEEQRDKFLNGLNKLSDENKELKQSIHDWQGSYDDLYEDNLKLEKENKELKEELIELIDASSDNRPNKKGFMGNGRFA